MAKMPKEVMDFFNDVETSKVLATVDAAGTLNVTPKGSLSAIDEETIAYAEVAGGKSESNLGANNKAAAASFKTQPPGGYQVKGTFQGFQTSGPLFDTFAKMLKEMAQIDLKEVGTIKVEEVYQIMPAKKLA